MKSYLNVGIDTKLPPGPHMTLEKYREFRNKLKVGDTIKARYIFRLEETAGHMHPMLNLGRPVPGAILNHHEFRITHVYPHQVELETFDRGDLWVCYVPIISLIIYGENTMIYSIRKVGA